MRKSAANSPRARQAEAALRESEERFRAVFQHAAAGIALVTFRHRILHTNVALQEMLGYTADELRGKSFAAITQPDDLKASMRLFKAAIAGKRSRVHLEKRLFRKDGRTVWTALNCHLHRDAAGKPLFMISLFENITERKRMEAALRLSEAKYRQLHESISDAYAGVDHEGPLPGMQPRLRAACGLLSEGTAAADLFGPHAEAMARLRVPDRSRTGPEARRPRTFTKRNTAERTERCFPWSCGPISSKILRVVRRECGPSSATSPSASRRRNSAGKRRALSHAVPQSAHRRGDCDARCRYLDANDAFCGMLGYSKEDLLRKTILDVTHPDDRPAFLKANADVWAGLSSSYSAERRYVRKDGSFLFGRITVQIVRDPEGKFLYGIGMLEDITARKRAEERLKTYQERLRSLASQLALAEERERRRIATALHDEVGQSLALARLKLGELAGVSRREEFTALVQTVYEMIAQILTRTRSLTFELSPPVLYELGFGEALGWLVEEFRKQHPIRWEFRADRLAPAGGRCPRHAVPGRAGTALQRRQARARGDRDGARRVRPRRSAHPGRGRRRRLRRRRALVEPQGHDRLRALQRPRAAGKPRRAAGD